MNKNSKKIFDITQIGLFAALITVCSWLSVPVAAVPVTMQTFAVFLALLLLGGKNGTLSVLVYILLGVLGVPVFSSFKSGPSVILGPTGGYIIGFILTGLVFLLFTKLLNDKLPVKIISLILGLFVCYGFGTLWFVFVYDGSTGFVPALSICVLPFILPDLIKLTLAVALSEILNPLLEKTKKQI